MKKVLFLFALLAAFSCSTKNANENPPQRAEWALALHGGAGNMNKADFSDEDVARYEQELINARTIGEDILAKGGTSLDAVEQVVRYLEDCPLFNAGKGAVFTNAGKNELDAAIMSGADLSAGAIAGVGDIKNPISTARLVMEKSAHVMMIGKGASEFAKSMGAEMVDSSYFFTDKSWQSLQRALQKAEKMGTG